MTLAEYANEIVRTWEEAMKAGRELSTDEQKYILSLQERAIKEHQEQNIELIKIEREGEEFAKHHLNFIKDKDNTCSRN